MSLGWSLLAVPFLIGMNAFFVAAEYALVAAKGYQIEAWRSLGYRKTADALARLKESPASSIGAIQVCITMTNLLLGWIGEPAMSRVLAMAFGPLIERWPKLMTGVSVALSFVIVTLLTVVLSEMLPKALTLRFVRPVAVLTAVPMGGIKLAIRPLVWVMNTLADSVTRLLGLGRVTEMEEQAATAQDLMMMAREAASDGVLSERERSIILNALMLGHRTARHVMVPRGKVVHLDLTWSMEENRRVALDHLYSYMPLCDGSMDQVVGIVSVKELIVAYYGHADTAVLRLIARPALFVPEHLLTDRLLTTMLTSKSRMFVVVDEFGGVDGIVTLDDVVADLLGVPASQGRDRPASAPAAASGGSVGPIELPGDTPIHEAATLLGRDGWGENPDVITVSGLVVAHLQRVPGVGEAVVIDGVEIRVLDGDVRTIRRLALQRVEKATADPHPGGDVAERGRTEGLM
jgi:CBS domain containing-hemolysin-like protein